jgi:CO/xanthine dehydrogenase FAD-binding subunit
MLPEFDLLMPQSLPEALHLLAEGAPDVTPLAGGTNLIPDMRGGSHHPTVMMNIATLDELLGIHLQDGHLVLGAGVTIEELLDDPLIAQHATVLRDAASVMANPLVRNRATLGGNLVNASPAADTAPPLLVLNAEVQLLSEQGARRVPLDQFFSGVGRTVREPQELLVSIRCPLPAAASATAHRKLALRKASAISVVSAAAALTLDGHGRCAQARIALGAVAPTPIRAYEAEKALSGQPPTSEAIAEAARLAVEATSCIDDIRGCLAYRQRTAEVLVRRLLSEAASAVN